ncbi:hypothetical protein J7I91_06495 [Pseudomonas sp. ISL-84]|nr:hypothetical protein [Pseudomonas sp. ISL-84]
MATIMERSQRKWSSKSAYGDHNGKKPKKWSSKIVYGDHNGRKPENMVVKKCL